MTTLLMLNIGNSDLLADGARPTAARPEGKALWESYDQHQFTLPIIEPCIENLLTQHRCIDTVLLFATDQDETPQTGQKDRSGVSLRDKDTLWFGPIIARYLSDRFAERLGILQPITLGRINPSLYDEAFDAYGALLAQHYDANAQLCYILMSGGIPACNTALQLQAISSYGERCRTIYQPERGEPYELRVGSQVLQTFQRATAINALTRHDFSTALAQVPDVTSAAIKHLIAYAHYRECFDFERAQMALFEGMRAASGVMRAFLMSYATNLIMWLPPTTLVPCCAS